VNEQLVDQGDHRVVCQMGRTAKYRLGEAAVGECAKALFIAVKTRHSEKKLSTPSVRSVSIGIVARVPLSLI
jgi:hypothetical protein